MKKYSGKKVELNNDGYLRNLVCVPATNIKELNRKIYVGAILRFDGMQGKITKLSGRWRLAEDENGNIF